MNLNKPTKQFVLNKLSAFEGEIEKLVQDSSRNKCKDFSALVIYADDLNEIIKNNYDDFEPIFFEQVRFKNVKVQSMLDKLFLKLAVPASILFFFVRGCTKQRVEDKTGDVGGYYTDIIYYTSLSIVILIGLFMFVKYYIIDKQKVCYGSDIYLCHLQSMHDYISNLNDEKFEQISFELAVKEL